MSIALVPNLYVRHFGSLSLSSRILPFPSPLSSIVTGDTLPIEKSVRGLVRERASKRNERDPNLGRPCQPKSSPKSPKVPRSQREKKRGQGLKAATYLHLHAPKPKYKHKQKQPTSNVEITLCEATSFV